MRPYWGTKQALPGPLGIWNYREIMVSVLGDPQWPSFAQRLSLGLLAEAQLGERGEDVDEADVRRAAEAFRRAEGLLTAEETEAWLTSQDLLAEEWEGFLVRRLLLERWGPSLAEHAVDLSGHPLFAEALFAEAVCSDFLPDARIRFAKLLALAEEGPPLTLPDGQALADELNARYPWLQGIAGHDVARVHAVLARAQQRLAEGTHDAEIAAMLHERTLDWTRVDGFELRVDSEQVCRELMLCARRERRPLVPTLAQRAGIRPRRRAFLLEDAPSSIKGWLAGAMPGDVVGPVRDGPQWTLYQLAERRAPSADDPQLVALARALLQEQRLDEAWVRHRRREASRG